MKQTVLVRYPDARRFMDFVSLVFETFLGNNAHGGAFTKVNNFIQGCTAGKIYSFGAMRAAKGRHVLSKDTQQYRQIAMALVFVLQNIFTLHDVNSVQIGRSLQKLPPRRGPTGPHSGLRTVIIWTTNVANAKTIHMQPNQGVRISDTIEDWKTPKVIVADHEAETELVLNDCFQPENVDEHTSEA